MERRRIVTDLSYFESAGGKRRYRGYSQCDCVPYPLPIRSGRVLSCIDTRPEAASHRAFSSVVVEDGMNPGSSEILVSPSEN